MTILQRTPVCNLKKTRILRPKYGWGYLILDAHFAARVTVQNAFFRSL